MHMAAAKIPSEPVSDHVKVTRALISVSDKKGLEELARALAGKGVEILSTGGTAKTLKELSFKVIDVGAYTGFPEMMDGRVKTLHPKIHGGILQRRNSSEHVAQAKQHDIPPIDLVIVNLYPFAETVAGGADFATCVENIDIGGPAMIRAAAKNHDHVAVLTSPDQYARFIAEFMKEGGSTTLEMRKNLAAEAYAHTARYDSMISNWMFKQGGEEFPPQLSLSFQRKQMLRYGENPHQQGAVYASAKPEAGVAMAEQIQGKELSYNNYNDADAAFELAAEFDEPTVAIIKHANPCGVASAASLTEAYRTAEAISAIFTEVIIAPEANEEARAVLAAKKNLRLLLTHGLPDPARLGLALRSIAGGMLVQSRDSGRSEMKDWKVVTKRQPSKEEMRDMLFAFRVGKHVKSNAIVYVKNEATVGVGAGQMSRVDSARIAAWKAGEAAKAAGLSEPLTKGSVVSSDAFFPFADGLMAAVDAGATAVIQPGGSMRDDEVIKAADNANLAMVFTGLRHFRH
jgi:phosphoribosylaminoimidazolecarboxamide formyltransferase/IMP cyclohydrolase